MTEKIVTPHRTTGDLLKRLRLHAGLSQQMLAEKSGVSLATIRTWEQGRRTPINAGFFRVATTLGVSMDVFGGLEDGKRIPDNERRELTYSEELGRILRCIRKLQRKMENTNGTAPA